MKWIILVLTTANTWEPWHLGGYPSRSQCEHALTFVRPYSQSAICRPDPWAEPLAPPTPPPPYSYAVPYLNHR